MFRYIPIFIIIIIIITTLTLLVIIIIIIILGINVPSLAKKRFSEIEFALGIVLSGTVMKYVNHIWHSRFFVIIAEPNINPNLNDNIVFDTATTATTTTISNNNNNCKNNVKNYHDQIVSKLNNSSKSKDKNSSNNNYNNNYQASNNSSITTDYYLLEYSTSVESKWGFIPIAYKCMYPIKHVVSIVIKAKKEFKITFDGSHEAVGGVDTDRRDEHIRYDNKSNTKESNSCSGGVDSQTDEPSTAPQQLPTNQLSSSSSSSSLLPQSASANRSNSRSKQHHHHQSRNKMSSTVTTTIVGVDSRHEHMRYDNISDTKSTSVETRWNRERKPVDNSSTVNDDHHGDDDLHDTDDTVVDNDESESSIEYKEEIDDDDDDMAIGRDGVIENDPNNVENVRYHYRKGTFRNDNVTKVNMTQPMSTSTTSNISTGTAGTVGVSLRKELYCKVLSPQDRVEWCETILKLGRCSSSKAIHSNIDFY